MLKKSRTLIVMLSAQLGAFFVAQAVAQQPPGQERPPMPVEAGQVEVGQVILSIPAIGSLKSSESVTISPEISGRISEIIGKEGQPVKAGELLVALDPSIYQAELAQAQASIALSKANYQRASELFDKRVGTQQARDEAQAGFLADEASLASAQARLTKTKIYAPFDGVLGLRRASVGQYVSPGEIVFNLEAIDPLKIDFRIPEIYLSKIKIGQQIATKLDALPGKQYTGTLYAIDPLIDQNGRSILIRATLPNDTGELRPGLFARLNLIYETRDQALLVPEQAVFFMGQQKFVYRIVEGRATLSPVTTGDRNAGKVEIVEGLSAGEQIIVAGMMKIFNGMPVAPLPACGSPSGPGGPPSGPGGPPSGPGGPPPGGPCGSPPAAPK